ncbi:proline-rich receptor kinase PERK1 [Chlorella sorokiniana]|uniref:Proline-rich receptor kinase PERK1 n=1 Tax=Chlorella sorokiniana TaxID=3076 RepID=A0A2P6TF75_CHLSO|nr:proline-rich receptor kinase PERK1 [Chlorella sorokiniana]|eukprot:PRW32624.1 proline-rich receptor kinase PERK1 [Chlorella sorokiniana]
MKGHAGSSTPSSPAGSPAAAAAPPPPSPADGQAQTQGGSLPPSSDSGGGGLDKGYIIGMSVGGAVLVSSLAVLVVMVRKTSKN